MNPSVPPADPSPQDPGVDAAGNGRGTSPDAAVPSYDAEGDREALQPILDRIRQQGPPGRIEVVQAFARAAFRRSSAEQLRSLDAAEAAARVLGAFAFIDGRQAGKLALRVFNPRRQEHGWTAAGTIVETNVEDQPFLLSTITEELARVGLDPVDIIHPVMGVERDAEGRVTAIIPARHARNRESWMQLELDAQLAPDRKEALTDDLRRVLSDARAAVRDFPAMRAQIEEVAFQTRASAGARYSPDEVDEAIALLYWLLDQHFILLGYREYELFDSERGRALRVTPGSGRGILSDESRSKYAEPVLLADIDEELRARVVGGDLLLVSRTNRVSTVQRRARMLYVGVKRVGGEGEIEGEFRFLGLFAQQAYAEPASSIPVLRRKLRRILEREDIVDHSHEERSLRALFESFPKYELFQASVDDLQRTLVDLLAIQQGQDVRLLCRFDPTRRSVSALVAVPRGRFNATIRQRVQDLLVRRFDAAAVDYHLSISERDQALLHFIIHTREGRRPMVSVQELEREVYELTRTWEDGLRAALVQARGDIEGLRLAREWAGRFPAGYTDTTDAATAVADIDELERLATDADGVRMALQRPPGHRREGEHDETARFKLYKAGPGVELSAFMPILESLGLTVVEEVPHRIEDLPHGPGGEIHIHDFGVRPQRDGRGFHAGRAWRLDDVEQQGPRLAEAALAAWRGEAESDSLNRLVLHAGLGWEQVAVLRAYRRYRLQVGTQYTEPYQNDALVEYPRVARALCELFALRFDPHAQAGEAEIKEARERVLEACDAVERLDQDRILRGFLGMVDATLRTNRYRPDRRQLSFKIASDQVPGMPKPVPYAEIFVYSPEMEGVHLRGGPVARGGIRWSDRLEDFRTEVLGLMKAQMVKNAVIVPTGSKGGFVLKRPPAAPVQLRAEVQRQYETYIRGLLDITDNVVGDDVVAPEHVRPLDGDDPYLVVAADKGTATFSDVANAISEEYGFWLADAFASGGSQGYDHKAMGITARGAWVAVQRHFRELNVDVQTDPITVVGIGDMSGDVFGNGLRRSRAVRLVAAFDHRDIFIDPDPDPEASFEERVRLYELPRSSWQDYDRARISPGGGVWSRTVKEIPLSEQARAALHIAEECLSPPELIRAILKAPVDLLFNGGIGTFVKASTETNVDVGDRANDAIRVDGDELGARVVGEGGNLALTQRGRIQYARRGGRLNTDAIDNSAGVDTSDREVTLKILLGAAIERGQLDAGQRNPLLGALTDEVAALVLRDVYLQTWTLSQELQQAPGGMEAYEAFMADLEAAGRLDREVEVLPSTEEMDHRREAGAGLTRPELAVLLGYAKVDLSARLLDSELPDEPFLVAAERAYFPPTAAERFAELLPAHRLRRELVATVMSNDIINRLGITYVSRTANEYGCKPWEVVAAYWVAREVADADAYWRAIEALDGATDPSVQLAMKADVDGLVDAFTRSYLRQGISPETMAETVAADRPAFEELEKAMMSAGSSVRPRAVDERVRHYTDLGIEADLAERLGILEDLMAVPDIAEAARATGTSVERVAGVFFRLSEELPMNRLYERLMRLSPTGHWQRWQHRGLVDDLRELRRAAAARALADYPDLSAQDTVEGFLADRASARERVASVTRLLEREGDADLAAIAVAVRALREALESSPAPAQRSSSGT